jgi:MFS family permease
MLLDLAPMRRHREFRLLVVGQLISDVGRQFTQIALPFQLYVLTREPISIGILAIVQLGPILVLSLVGGVIADLVDRRRLLIATQTGLLITSGLLALVASMPDPPLLLIYAIAFIAAALGAVDTPARRTAAYSLVPRAELAWAVSMTQAGNRLAQVIGPAVGGVAIASLGLPAAYAFDSLSFLVTIGVLLAMAPIPGGALNRFGVGAIVEGLRFARQTPSILGTFVIDLDAMIFGLPTALFPILSLETFHAGAEGVGLMTSAVAAGSLGGTLLSGWVTGVRRQGLAVLVAVVVWGGAIAAFGLSEFSFPLALGFLVIAGAADIFSTIFRATILQVGVPDALRGRLSALHIMVVTGGPRLGDLESTAVASLVSAQFSVISGGLLCVLGVAAVALAFPKLRTYDANVALADAQRRDAEHAQAAATG